MRTKNRPEQKNVVRSLVLVLLLLIFVASASFAGGGREPEWHSLDLTGHWQHEIDLSDFDPGTWNVVIRARDQGGNETIGGPFNLTIDPLSDLPISSVIYPEEGQIVRGNLSIVGVAADDDAVGTVEVSLDDGPFVRATGAEYWRLSVDAALVSEGPHQIRVRALDIKGVEGPVSLTNFIVDRTVPAIGISSHKPGIILGGNVQFRGQAADVNGILRAAYRIPAYTITRNEQQLEIPEKVQDIFLRHNQQGDVADFDFTINTRDLPDGPRIIWLSAVDRTGSSVEVPFLFFVDNNNPVIRVLSPEQDFANKGSLLITGTVHDAVGVQNFWFTLRGQRTDIPLTPGNPYWTIQLDTFAENGPNTELEFVAEDTSGNRTSLRFRSRNDKEGSRPVVEVLQPLSTGNNSPTQVVPGSAVLGRLTSPNTPQLVKVTGLDPADARVVREFPARYGFRIPLDNLPAGRRQLSIVGVDNLGFESRPINLAVLVLPEAPVVQPREIRYADGRSEPWAGWAVFDGSPRAVLAGTITSTAKLNRAVAVFGPEVAAADAGSLPQRGQALNLKVADGGYSFELPLDQAAALNGLVDLGIWTVDEFGAVQSVVLKLAVRDKRASEAGVTFLLPGIESGAVTLGQGRTLLGGFVAPVLYGRNPVQLSNLELVLPEGIEAPVQLQRTGTQSAFTLRALADGVVRGALLRAQWSDGSTFDSHSFDIVVDNTAPQIALGAALASGVQYSQDQNSFQLTATIEDGDALARLEYSLDAGLTWTALPVPGGTGPWNVSASIDTGTQRAQAFAFLLRAVDRAGNAGLAASGINRRQPQAVPTDANRRNDAARIEVLAPHQNSLPVIGALPTVVLSVTDFDGVATVEAAGQDGNWQVVARPNSTGHYTTVVFQVPRQLLSEGTTQLRFRATDRLGLAGQETRAPVNFKQSAARFELEGIQEASLQGRVYRPGQQIQLGGSLSSAAFFRTLAYSLDGGEQRPVQVRNGADATSKLFTVQIPALQYSGAFQTLLLTATDNYGQTSVLEMNFIVLAEADRQVDLQLRSAGTGYAAGSAAVSASTAGSPSAGGSTATGSGAGSNTLVFHNNDPIYLHFDGPAPTAVTVPESAAGIVAGSVQNGRIVLRQLGAGSASGVQFEVRDAAGITYTSAAFTIVSDTRAPNFAVRSPAAQSSQAAAPQFVVSLQDDLSTIADGLRLEGRANGSPTWVRLPLAEHPDDATLSIAETSVLGLVPGQNIIELAARDASGKTVTRWLELVLDPAPPQVSFMSPPAEDIVNGRTLVTATIDSISDLQLVEVSEDGESWLPVTSSRVLTEFVDFSRQSESEVPWRVRVTNAAGSVAEAEFLPQTDLEADLPELLIQTPAPDSVQTEDFTISGMAFDDDGIQTLVYRFDEGEWKTLPGDTSFSVLVELANFADNEHVFEAYAVDTFGRNGETSSLTFKISLNEPVIEMTAPTVDQTGSGVIVLEGTAQDKNGIATVEISLDNGTSFYLADGTEDWTYKLDSRVFTDGTYSVQIRATDNYGVVAQYFTLANVDNTAPFLEVSGPREAESVAGRLGISGRVADAVSLVSLKAIIEPVNAAEVTLTEELALDEIILHTVDISSLPAGLYNLRVEAVDGAGNTTSVDKNLVVEAQAATSRVYFLFPQEGERVAGELALEGRVESLADIKLVQIYSDDKLVGTGEVNPLGYFRVIFEDGSFASGRQKVKAIIEPGNGERIESPARAFDYVRTGPVLTIDSHVIGSFLANRPWLEGRAGYLSDLDPGNNDDREALRQLEVARLRISLDNGRTWTEVPVTDGKWRYRVETGSLIQGPLAVILRAEYRNGEDVARRSIFTIDKTYPRVELLGPGEGSLLNENVVFKGTASDDYSLSELEIAFRRGDKAGYSVPEFVQGMYLDLDLFGLTYWKIGLGFTFFEGSVKLQANFGLGPETTASGDPARLSGYFIGGKLLAKIFTLPFDALFGPDWSWLSLNFSVGADFSYVYLYEPIVITNAVTGKDRVIEGVVLSAILAQLEFPTVHIEGWDAFHTFSFYLEPEVWFVPSDVDPQVIPKLTMGFRIGLF